MVAESLAAYEPYYKALARLREEKPAGLEGLEGLIAGYGKTLGKNIESIKTPGAPPAVISTPAARLGIRVFAADR